MAADAVAGVAEEVALNLEEVAEVTRKVNSSALGFFVSGVGVGCAVGFYVGYRIAKAKTRAEAMADAEDEIELMRVHYQQKTIASEPKPTAEQIIEERGYSTFEPPAPPRPLPAPVPVDEPIETPAVVLDVGKSKNDGWNFPKELEARSADAPYVIHQDEFNEDENGYNHVTYTYYAQDDVLVDEDDRPLPHGDLVVGQDNLKFGHGADDVDVVYVRNDRLQIEMEICRSSGSYEQEVMGLERDESS
jgi:hypothetical protein